MPFTHFHIDFESKCFVPTSATFFKPSTFINSMRRSWMCFCSHKHGVCKCRTLPTPRLLAMPAPAVASYRNLALSVAPKSFAISTAPSKIEPPFTKP
jgi:hypothetical protein